MKPNPNWVDAEPQQSVLLYLPIPDYVKTWSRKRRLRWIRRAFKQTATKYVGRFDTPPGGWFTSEVRFGVLPEGYRLCIPILYKRSLDKSVSV